MHPPEAAPRRQDGDDPAGRTLRPSLDGPVPAGPSEQGVLRLSIAATLALAGLGILFGLRTGSAAILFDGVYSLADASMTVLALLVARLIAVSTGGGPGQGRLVERFTMGFWHLEPMVLGLSGTLLIGAALYALVNAVESLLAGGRLLRFDDAILYAAATLAAALAMAVFSRRAARRLGSAFLALDAEAWAISAALSAALLVAFLAGALLEGGPQAWLAPYADPAVLALVCLAVIPVPMGTVRQALADILLVTPPALKQQVDAVAAAAVARHGILDHRAYVARVGRGRQIELCFIVPEGAPARPLEEWDAIRDEIGAAIGGDTPDRWLTIVFTTDPDWAD